MARILIVDDDRVMRRMLAAILRHAGHEIVAFAPNGRAAVELYRRHRPDVATMDYAMPMLDGLASMREILGEHPDARIVMVTAVGRQQPILEALEAGASEFVVKPFHEARVVAAVASVLARPR